MYLGSAKSKAEDIFIFRHTYPKHTLHGHGQLQRSDSHSEHQWSHSASCSCGTGWKSIGKNVYVQGGSPQHLGLLSFSWISSCPWIPVLLVAGIWMSKLPEAAALFQLLVQTVDMYTPVLLQHLPVPTPCPELARAALVPQLPSTLFLSLETHRCSYTKSCLHCLAPGSLYPLSISSSLMIFDHHRCVLIPILVPVTGNTDSWAVQPQLLHSHPVCTCAHSIASLPQKEVESQLLKQDRLC